MSPQRLLSPISLFAVCACVAVASAQNNSRPVCTLQTPTGELFNMNSYSVGPPWRKLFEDINTQVIINFCSNNASSCAENASIVVLDVDGNCKGMIAFWSAHEDAAVSYIDEDQRNRGIQAVFTNGKADSCPENDTVTTTLNLLCASAHQDPNVPSFEYREIHPNNSARICDFEINFEAPEACDSRSPPTREPRHEGLSGGWVFTIIVVVFFAAYFLGGMLFNCMITGAKGAESVPNISFWRSLPGLVQDGISYTKSALCGGSVYGSSAQDAYREVGPSTTYGSQDTAGISNGAGGGPQFSESSNATTNNAL